MKLRTGIRFIVAVAAVFAAGGESQAAFVVTPAATGGNNGGDWTYGAFDTYNAGENAWTFTKNESSEVNFKDFAATVLGLGNSNLVVDR